MSNLGHLQQRLRTSAFDALLIPSTDEYLSEFARPFGRRLRWATGFRGSTGVAIVLRERAALFVDSRYRFQAEQDVGSLGVEILAAGEAARHRWLAANLSEGQRLAIDTRLQSYPEVEQTLKFAVEHGVHVIALAHNPIDELWGREHPAAPASTVTDYPTDFAGAPAQQKCQQLQDWLVANRMDCHLLADPEDVAWLLNVRTNDDLMASEGEGWQILPIPLSRVLVEATGKVFWFIEQARLDPALRERPECRMQIVDPAQFEGFLQERTAGKIVGANLRRTPHRFAAIAAKVGTIKDDPIVARRRWKKHPQEVARAREGHFQDGKAVIRFLAWVQRTVRERIVTELEAAQKLTEFRAALPRYRGISMPLMSASGASGAMAHYTPSERSNRRLNDHPLYWMDSGGQYYGCSTDNTVCIALGTPEPRHIHAHTLVLKGHLALARARFPAGIASTQIDSFARQYLWQAGMDYGHGTGHGVGNFMNIHEGPYIRRDIDHPMVAPLEVGMIVSNEPAYYLDGDFGVRIESHLVIVESPYEGYLQFETLSRLPIDPHLIDETLLRADEKKWLADYHLWICAGYRGCFDDETARWLQELTDCYVGMSQR